jgi:hypothetical protein
LLQSARGDGAVMTADGVFNVKLSADFKQFGKTRRVLLSPAFGAGLRGGYGTRHAACEFLSKGLEGPVLGQEAQAMQMHRALVTIAPNRRAEPATHGNGCASADFVAHLIATAGDAPQTRARRRGTLEDAVAAYAVLGHWPTEPGGILSRSL